MKQWLSAVVPGEGEVSRWEWVRHTGLHLVVLGRRSWRGVGGVVLEDWGAREVGVFHALTRNGGWPVADVGLVYPSTWDARGLGVRVARYRRRDLGLFGWWQGLRDRCEFEYGCDDGLGVVRLPVARK